MRVELNVEYASAPPCERKTGGVFASNAKAGSSSMSRPSPSRSFGHIGPSESIPAGAKATAAFTWQGISSSASTGS